MENFAEFVRWLKQEKDRNIAVVGEQTPCVGFGCAYGPSPIAMWLDAIHSTLGSQTRLNSDHGSVVDYVEWRFDGPWEKLESKFAMFSRMVDSKTAWGRDGDDNNQRITAKECLEIVEYISRPLKIREITTLEGMQEFLNGLPDGAVPVPWISRSALETGKFDTVHFEYPGGEYLDVRYTGRL